jgi:hypothetical protein
MIPGRKKHEARPGSGKRPASDGAAVLASQSPFAATVAGVVAATIVTAAWLASVDLLNRVFPWFVVLQGILIGLSVRRWGQGFDWRFPALAALLAIVAAYAGNFLLAAHVAAIELDTTVLRVVLGMSQYTLGTYFDEVITPVDHVYAAYSAALAAFFARRRLTRAEVFAIRTAERKMADHDRST